MAEHSSPRVNSARLAQYIGKTVRLPCRVVKLHGNGESAIVEASDGGEVVIKLARVQDVNMTTTHVEVIGKVVDAGTIQMLGCYEYEGVLDMKIVNQVVELTHDPRFAKLFF